MDASESVGWDDGDSIYSTLDPNISVAAVEDEVPTITVATIVGVSVVVVTAIIVVFVLGIFIDCRQQRLNEKKMAYLKKMKSIRVTRKSTESEDVSITANMEEQGTSIPPAAALRNIP